MIFPFNYLTRQRRHRRVEQRDGATDTTLALMQKTIYSLDWANALTRR